MIHPTVGRDLISDSTRPAASGANELTTRNPKLATEERDYFTDEERAGLAHWRAIVADMPPITQDEIDRVAAIFRRIDARRRAAS